MQVNVASNRFDAFYDRQSRSKPAMIPLRMTPLIVENVQKHYRQGEKQVVALDGVSLSVDAGSFVAVMGASGSGKSTLLHLMSGLTTADEGSVIINGTNLTRLTDHQLTLFRRRHIGLVFQSFNLIPSLTARQNLSLPLLLDRRHGESENRRVDELLEQLGIRDRADHRPDALSGGEQQRIAIGRALVTDPAVIFADEPTGNLDSVNSDIVCELLRDLCATQGKTIVMVTHEPTVAAYAQRVLIIKDGKLLQTFENDAEQPHLVAERYHLAMAR
jgi:putative ABC transport system ATP-binding protein